MSQISLQIKYKAKINNGIRINTNLEEEDDPDDPSSQQMQERK